MPRDEKSFKSPFSLFDLQSLSVVLSSAFTASQKNQEHLNETSEKAKSDVVALFVIIFKGYIPNCALAVEAMLATASLGAIWSSTSPDFGVSVIVNYNLILKMHSWAFTNGHLSIMVSLFCFPGYFVLQFYPCFKFCFPLFWGMVMYD